MSTEKPKEITPMQAELISHAVAKMATDLRDPMEIQRAVKGALEGYDEINSRPLAASNSSR